MTDRVAEEDTNSDVQDEKLRELPEWMQMSKYMATWNGNVWSRYSKKFMTPKKDGNYLRVHITYDDGKRSTVPVHRIIAMAFIPNPDDIKTVDHISRVSTDNRVINLRWCDHHGQNMNRVLSGKPTNCRKVDQYSKKGEFIQTWNSIIEATHEYGNCVGSSKEICRVCKGEIPYAYGFIWRYTPIEVMLGEVWKEIPGFQNYFVSTEGRTKLIKSLGPPLNEMLITGYLDHTGYIQANILSVRIQMHRLICYTFHGPPPDINSVTDHINAIRTDNRPANLRWLSPLENTVAAYETGCFDMENLGKLNKKPVCQYTLKWKLVKEYDGIGDAARAMGVCDTAIVKACSSRHRSCRQFKWVKTSDLTKEELEDKITQQFSKISLD
jgi:HNH endonuclease/NUMOD1 domain